MAQNVLQKFLPAQEILEATFLLIVVYLVLSRAFEFSTIIRALSNSYVSGVTALQGR